MHDFSAFFSEKLKCVFCLICLKAMSKCLSLPGIQKVWYIPCNRLPDDVVYRAVAGIPISLQETPTIITLNGEAVCEVEQSFDNNSYIEKAKLQFLTLDDVPADQHPTFVIKTANNELYLLGAKERPYPTVKITSSTGQPDGDASVRKYEVSFTAKKALALCTG